MFKVKQNYVVAKSVKENLFFYKKGFLSKKMYFLSNVQQIII